MSLAEILTWIYLIGVAVSWPILARCAVRYDLLRQEGRIDGEGMAMMILIGLVTAFFWPLMIPGYWIWEWLQKEVETDERW